MLIIVICWMYDEFQNIQLAIDIILWVQSDECMPRVSSEGIHLLIIIIYIIIVINNIAIMSVDDDDDDLEWW